MIRCGQNSMQPSIRLGLQGLSLKKKSERVLWGLGRIASLRTWEQTFKEDLDRAEEKCLTYWEG